MTINNMDKSTNSRSLTAAPHRPMSENSPFDQIRRIRPDKSEFWSARDLMPLLGYRKWQYFQNAIERAKASSANTGHDADLNFVQVSKLTDARNLGPQERIDYELTRFASYLVAMNGDPNKAEVAAAQAYFAIRTREAEVGAVRTESLSAATTTEIDAAVDQVRLLSVMRGIISDEELAGYGRVLLDRHLGIEARAAQPALDTPLSPHQFLLDKGVSAFEAEIFLSPFCEAAVKASHKLTGRVAPSEVAVLGKRITQRSYEFTEADRPAMEAAWKSLRIIA
ncbi:BRO family protein [Mycobacteroides abscessus]|uniref:BRO family protein n=1 Tax=Mycobacteroides abscessus TaxID=36809 RepID=UPI00194FE8AA|nr:BRO family protein [Mycobacteroides abscessus]